MITIFIDNKPYQVRPDQNLLQACLTLGFDLPYFCWHPALHSVGACRQCAVKQFKDDKDTRGRIVMSCMTPVSEGMRLSVDDPEAKAFRKSVVEWLMLNHPHDCPVCDEGGECHLQDMTVMTGHNYRRNRFPKRTHRNQDLGPFLNHEMNRCIQCYRCVRFYRGTAGGRDLDVFGCHDHVYFGRHEDGALESEFSGNLVEICPTGVFTDKTLKEHYTRKWDLRTAPSVCVHCGIGCNTLAGERYGTLRRILNRYNREVNGYFLCDRGRFGYGFVNSDRRIRSGSSAAAAPFPEQDEGEGNKPVTNETALAQVAAILSKAKGIIGIGSPRASLESNFALRSLVGENNFYSGMASGEQALLSLIIDIQRKRFAVVPSLVDMQAADAVLILGEDLPNTAPMMALAVRQAARNRQFEIAAGMKLPPWDDHAVRNAGQHALSPVYLITPRATRLDDIAAGTFHAGTHDIALLGAAIARAIDRAAPSPSPGERTEANEEREKLARGIAVALKNAHRPLIVSGTGCMSEAVIKVAANIAQALRKAGKTAHLAYAVLECNSLGSALLDGRTLDEAFTAMRDGLADTVVVLENDLFRRENERSIAEFLAQAKNVVVIDHITHRTASRAQVLLPAATFAEASGTLVNYESRPQRFHQVVAPAENILAGWKWIAAIMNAGVGPDRAGRFETLDAVIDALAGEMPTFAPLREIAPPAGFRLEGQKVPRDPHRYSGRTSMHADKTVHEPKPPEDADTPLAFSLEGSEQQPPPPLISRYWSPRWNSVQALNKFQQEVGGPLRNDRPGRRLIEQNAEARPAYFEIALEKEMAAAPEYSLFGSEELSSLSPAVQKRIFERSKKETKRS